MATAVSLTKTLKKTVPNARVIGVGYLPGFERVFNFKSPYRHNSETGIYSSVLNLREADAEISGAIIEMPDHELDALYIRERGYEKIERELLGGQSVFTFMSFASETYNYIEHDPIQDEYLGICLTGAEVLGEEVYENFLDTTWLSDRSVREYLESKKTG